jgi:hypothetical protein
MKWNVIIREHFDRKTTTLTVAVFGIVANLPRIRFDSNDNGSDDRIRFKKKEIRLRVL